MNSSTKYNKYKGAEGRVLRLIMSIYADKRESLHYF